MGAAGRAACGGRLRRAGTCAASALRGAAAGLRSWRGGAGVRVSPGAGISVMRCWLVILPKPSYKQRVFAPLFLAPCLRSAPSVLPALLRSASCFSFPSEQRCYSSPERVIFIGLELMSECGCGLCLWQANAGLEERCVAVVVLCCRAPGQWAGWQSAAPRTLLCQLCERDGRGGECRSYLEWVRAVVEGGTKSHNLARSVTRDEQLCCYRLRLDGFTPTNAVMEYTQEMMYSAVAKICSK